MILNGMSKMHVKGVVPYVPIDVGVTNTEPTFSFSSDKTIIQLGNPANATGIITNVELNIGTSMVGLIIGTFSFSSGNTYICKSSLSIGSLSVGINTLIDLSLSINVGDYIGCYYSSGSIYSPFTGAGLAWLSGSHISVNDSGVYTISDRDLYLYGSG